MPSVGSWQLHAIRWRLQAIRWRLHAIRWRLHAIGWRLAATRHPLTVTCHPLAATCHRLAAARHQWRLHTIRWRLHAIRWRLQPSVGGYTPSVGGYSHPLAVTRHPWAVTRRPLAVTRPQQQHQRRDHRPHHQHRSSQVNDLLEKESALKEGSHQLAVAKRQQTAREAMLGTLQSEKQGFAEIAGERDAALGALQQRNAELEVQLQEAAAQRAAQAAELQGLRDDNALEADRLCQRLMTMCRFEAVSRMQLWAEVWRCVWLDWVGGAALQTEREA